MKRVPFRITSGSEVVKRNSEVQEKFDKEVEVFNSERSHYERRKTEVQQRLANAIPYYFLQAQKYGQEEFDFRSQEKQFRYEVERLKKATGPFQCSRQRDVYRLKLDTHGNWERKRLSAEDNCYYSNITRHNLNVHRELHSVSMPLQKVMMEESFYDQLNSHVASSEQKKKLMRLSWLVDSIYREISSFRREINFKRWCALQAQQDMATIILANAA